VEAATSSFAVSWESKIVLRFAELRNFSGPFQNYFRSDHPLATTLGIDHTALFDLLWREFMAALAQDFLSV